MSCWTERKRNDTILQKICGDRNIITKRKVKLVGYVIRNYDFVTNILEGHIMGKRPIGRLSLYQHLKNTARDKEDWLRQDLAFRN